MRCRSSRVARVAVAALGLLLGCGGEQTFGARAGVLLSPSGELRDHDPNAVLGVSWGLEGPNGSRISYELGGDMGLREESGGFSSLPLGGRFDVLFRMAESPGGARGYLLSGASGHVEFVEGLSSGREYTNYAAGIDLGFGVVFVGGKLDVRVSHAVLLGSENLDGQTLVSAGYAF